MQVVMFDLPYYVLQKPSFISIFSPKSSSKPKNSVEKRDSGGELSLLKRADSFTLADYTAEILAEQLTLIEQV